MAPDNTAQIQQIQTQLNADPRVLAAFAKYQQTHSQPDFNAYLESVKPYLAQIDQSKWGINPQTGEIQGTSNYGHPWKLAIGMATGAALPYGPYAGGATASADKVVDKATAYDDGGLSDSVNAAGNTANDINTATTGVVGGGNIDWQKLLGPATSGGVDLVKLLTGLAPLIPALMKPGQSDATQALTSQQNDLLKLQTQRMKDQDPLFQSTLRGYQAMLPTFAKGPQ